MNDVWIMDYEFPSTHVQRESLIDLCLKFDLIVSWISNNDSHCVMLCNSETFNAFLFTVCYCLPFLMKTPAPMKPMGWVHQVLALQ